MDARTIDSTPRNETPVDVSLLSQYAQELKYNRFTIQAVDASEKEKIENAATLLNQIINNSEQDLTPTQKKDFDLVSIQCGLYFAYTLQNYPLAAQYFRSHQLLKDLLQATDKANYAADSDIEYDDILVNEIWGYYLYSLTIDELPLTDLTDSFSVLLNRYESLEDNYENYENVDEVMNRITLAVSFTSHYFALYLHKKSLVADLPQHEVLALNEQAKTLLVCAIDMATELEKAQPYIVLDLAATHHLMSDILVTEERYDEALEAVNKASDYMVMFNLLIKRKHFLTLTLQHAHGDILFKLKKYPESLVLLADLLEKLEEFYQTDESLKAAITLTLIGQVHEKYELNYMQALECYKQALGIFKVLSPKDVSITENRINILQAKLDSDEIDIDALFERLQLQPHYDINKLDADEAFEGAVPLIKLQIDELNKRINLIRESKKIELGTRVLELGAFYVNANRQSRNVDEAMRYLNFAAEQLSGNSQSWANLFTAEALFIKAQLAMDTQEPDAVNAQIYIDQGLRYCDDTVDFYQKNPDTNTRDTNADEKSDETVLVKPPTVESVQSNDLSCARSSDDAKILAVAFTLRDGFNKLAEVIRLAEVPKESKTVASDEAEQVQSLIVETTKTTVILTPSADEESLATHTPPASTASSPEVVNPLPASSVSPLVANSLFSASASGPRSDSPVPVASNDNQNADPEVIERTELAILKPR